MAGLLLYPQSWSQDGAAEMKFPVCETTSTQFYWMFRSLVARPWQCAAGSNKRSCSSIYMCSNSIGTTSEMRRWFDQAVTCSVMDVCTRDRTNGATGMIPKRSQACLQNALLIYLTRWGPRSWAWVRRSHLDITKDRYSRPCKGREWSGWLVIASCHVQATCSFQG
jgi:hypothetical protein